MKRHRTGFIEKTINGLTIAFDQAAQTEALSAKPGLLQSLDPRVRVVGTLGLIIAAATSRSLSVLTSVFILSVVLALVSHLTFGLLARRVWIGAILVTGAVAVPALFITPGQAVAVVPGLNWHISAQGIGSALFLIVRVLTSATLAVTLVLVTPWTHVLKALRALYVPTLMVVILGMTYRYIFLLLESARDMFESRRSRTVGYLAPVDERRMATASAGVLLTKSFQLSSDVFLAMQSRGWRGEVYVLDEFKMTTRDWLALGAYLMVAAGLVWWGR